MAWRDTNWESRIGRRLKLRDLHILSTVVESGSMAKGARKLGMSQPAVSESISILEDALRVRLLDRSTKGVEPTIYAHALLARGHIVFDELKQGIRDIEFLADPGAGEVRIGSPESLMAGFVPAIIDRMTRQHPKVVVRAVNAQPGEQQFRALHERNLDLMLGRVLRPLHDADVETEVLCEDHFLVVAGAQNPWARRRKLTLPDLAQEPWIMFPTDSLIAAHFSAALLARGMEPPRETVASFSMHVRMQLLATGRFLTIMHSSTLRYYAKPWSLAALQVDLNIPPVPIALFKLRKRTLSPVVRLFIEQTRAVSNSLTKTDGKRA
jgi:DNA-binding transcriptional LysR family regulator